MAWEARGRAPRMEVFDSLVEPEDTMLYLADARRYGRTPDLPVTDRYVDMAGAAYEADSFDTHVRLGLLHMHQLRDEAHMTATAKNLGAAVRSRAEVKGMVAHVEKHQKQAWVFNQHSPAKSEQPEPDEPRTSNAKRALLTAPSILGSSRRVLTLKDRLSSRRQQHNFGTGQVQVGATDIWTQGLRRSSNSGEDRLERQKQQQRRQLALDPPQYLQQPPARPSRRSTTGGEASGPVSAPLSTLAGPMDKRASDSGVQQPLQPHPPSTAPFADGAGAGGHQHRYQFRQPSASEQLPKADSGGSQSVQREQQAAFGDLDEQQGGADGERGQDPMTSLTDDESDQELGEAEAGVGGQDASELVARRSEGSNEPSAGPSGVGGHASGQEGGEVRNDSSAPKRLASPPTAPATGEDTWPASSPANQPGPPSTVPIGGSDSNNGRGTSMMPSLPAPIDVPQSPRSATLHLPSMPGEVSPRRGTDAVPMPAADSEACMPQQQPPSVPRPTSPQCPQSPRSPGSSWPMAPLSPGPHTARPQTFSNPTPPALPPTPGLAAPRPSSPLSHAGALQHHVSMPGSLTSSQAPMQGPPARMLSSPAPLRPTSRARRSSWLSLDSKQAINQALFTGLDPRPDGRSESRPSSSYAASRRASTAGSPIPGDSPVNPASLPPDGAGRFRRTSASTSGVDTELMVRARNSPTHLFPAAAGVYHTPVKARYPTLSVTATGMSPPPPPGFLTVQARPVSSARSTPTNSPFPNRQSGAIAASRMSPAKRFSTSGGDECRQQAVPIKILSLD